MPYPQLTKKSPSRDSKIIKTFDYSSAGLTPLFFGIPTVFGIGSSLAELIRMSNGAKNEYR